MAKKSVEYFREAFRNELDDPCYRHAVLLKLNANQTAEEKAQKKTMYLNGVGFTASDARVLGRLAMKVKAAKTLLDWEDELIRQSLKKYYMQFARPVTLGELTNPAAAIVAALNEKETHNVGAN